MIAFPVVTFRPQKKHIRPEIHWTIRTDRFKQTIEAGLNFDQIGSHVQDDVLSAHKLLTGVWS